MQKTAKKRARPKKLAAPPLDTGRLMHSISLKAEGISVKCVVAQFEFEGDAPVDLVDTLADLLGGLFRRD